MFVQGQRLDRLEHAVFVDGFDADLHDSVSEEVAIKRWSIAPTRRELLEKRDMRL
jgi:hypothetical protein